MAFAYNSRRDKCKDGFTFVELVIAIAILGILAIVVVPNINRYLKEAKENTTVTNIKVIKGEVDAYIRKVGRAPQNLRDLVRKPADISKREWGGPYLDGDEIPKDGWGAEFQYKLKPGGNPPYTLYSWGADGPGSSEEEWIYP